MKASLVKSCSSTQGSGKGELEASAMATHEINQEKARITGDELKLKIETTGGFGARELEP